MQLAPQHPLITAIAAVTSLSPRCRWLLSQILSEISSTTPPAAIRSAKQTRTPVESASHDNSAWASLRAATRRHLKSGSISRPELAQLLGISERSLVNYLGRPRPPSRAVQQKLQEWLETAETAPKTRLSKAEQGRLSGYLSLTNPAELRTQFGLDRNNLEQAAAGEPLAAPLIARLRATLSDSGAVAAAE